MKRLFDLLSSSIGFLILLPLFLIISLLIWIFMPGPVFFIQERVGKDRKPFRLYKFRTMKVESKKEEGSFDAGDTSRVTFLGKILRKNKLDELPQLLNVIKGDMSLVGPRPEVKRWTEVYSGKWDIVLTVKPGITDNASIIFRNEEEILSNYTNPIEIYEFEILPKKLQHYIAYVNDNSFWGDIKIIFKTFRQMIIK